MVERVRSYGEDKDYLRAIRRSKEKGVTCPLFLHRMGHGEQRKNRNPDWRRIFRRETSVPVYNFGQMQEFLTNIRNGPDVWIRDGWFTCWKEPVIQTQKLSMRSGAYSTTLAMFHGGNHFGFMNVAVFSWER